MNVNHWCFCYLVHSPFSSKTGTPYRPPVAQPPEELRSQMPWSYLGPRKPHIKPKPKPVTLDEEDLEMPPVPVPDYTLHFGKTARPSSVNWSDDGTSVTDSAVDDRGSSVTGVVRRTSCKYST
jgi:hypothetical protein